MWSGNVFVRFGPFRNQAHLSSSNLDSVLHFHIHLFTPFGGPAVTRLIFLWHFCLIFISFLHLYTVALAFCEGQCGFQTLFHSIKMERREGAWGSGAQGNRKCLQREVALLGKVNPEGGWWRMGTGLGGGGPLTGFGGAYGIHTSL